MPAKKKIQAKPIAKPSVKTVKNGWDLKDVRDLCDMMGQLGVSIVELHGLKVVRYERPQFFDPLAEKKAEPAASDDDILLNPYAGLGVNHG